ncbi:MAG: hypothetical protein WB611_27630 [Stellaceae bacterium]
MDEHFRTAPAAPEPAAAVRSSNSLVQQLLRRADRRHHALRRALGFGKTEEELKAEGSPDFQTPFRVSEGNRPTNMILAERLDPATLGSLDALYEHSVYTQGATMPPCAAFERAMPLQRQSPHRRRGRAPSQTRSRAQCEGRNRRMRWARCESAGRPDCRIPAGTTDTPRNAGSRSAPNRTGCLR